MLRLQIITKSTLNSFLKNSHLTVTLYNNTVKRHFNDISFEEIIDISPSTIKRTLAIHKLNYEEGHTCFMINCPVCQVNVKSMNSPKLYINKTTGTFQCPSCMSHGNWNNFEVYAKLKKTKTKQDFSNLDVVKKYLKDVETTTVPLRSIPEQDFLNICENFQLPTISQSILQHVAIRTDETRSFLYFPLENVLSSTVGYKIMHKCEDGSIQTKIEPSLCTGVLTGKSTKAKDSAVIVPNISDFLILLNQKLANYIVCLPNGLINLPQYILPSLERFNKLTLWFGNDLSSWDSARNFAKKLNEKRCLFIRPTEMQPLPHEAMDRDLKAIIAGAKPIWHKSITTFSSLREDVLSELQNIDKVHGIKWKRFPTLNRLLKGHRKGELTVITGPTGCGKTTFISEYSLDLAMQGVNTLWGSFEIRNVRLAKTMLQQLVGVPLDKNIENFDSYADDFEKLPIYYMTFHGQQSVKIVMEAVEHAQYVHDISHVIIDNLQFMMGVSEDQKSMDRFWKQDLIIGSFRAFATRKNCHVTLVIHPRKERDVDDLTTSSIFGGAKASQEADNILIIQDKSLTLQRGKKYLQIAKNRYSGDIGVMNLEFDKNALSFAPKKKKSVENADVVT
ncbi:hypothetical protein RN001_010074 [Aquatica leii]|uniref:DNA 5'-3' helicase n=1 Tax=Aquatica leii TaxID=1421715 RepID=A0AAN7P7F3_9COLE|nr:hypothetical protein RN001_010074 [Aquatica leii]